VPPRPLLVTCHRRRRFQSPYPSNSLCLNACIIDLVYLRFLAGCIFDVAGVYSPVAYRRRMDSRIYLKWKSSSRRLWEISICRDACALLSVNGVAIEYMLVLRGACRLVYCICVHAIVGSWLNRCVYYCVV